MIGHGHSAWSRYAARALFLSIMAPAAANAQTLEEAAESRADTAVAVGSNVYRPADFARFAPRTALDLVEKIPDFVLSETSDQRGLGEASQNILINGQRVAGKDNDARSALAQIAASAVDRIEVTDAARTGIPGLTGRVANVVVRSGDIRVQIRWEGQNRRNIPDQWTSGAISASGRIGATEFTLSLSNSEATRRGGLGPEVVVDSVGRLITLRQQRDVYRVDSPQLSGTLHRETTAGSIFNLRLSGELYSLRANFDGVAAPASGSPLTTEHFRQSDRDRSIEAGGDYEFALGGGRLKLIGLQRYDYSPSTTTFQSLLQAPGSVARGLLFERTSSEGESVLRGEYRWGSAGADWQLAAEAAYNFLDVRSAIGSLQPDGSFVRQPLAGGDTFVDEWRGNLALSRAWTLAAGLSLQTSVGAEYSRIRQTSAGGLSRAFVRPKGLAALAWTINPQWTVNASLERQVGQLSFFDFSAAVDLNAGVASAGNVRLVPDQSWRAEAEIAHSLGAGGSITLGGYAEWISDIVDRIPITATEEGVGNLPSARRWGLTARGTLLLDGLGWRGGRINATGDFRWSSVRDPLTGEERRISEDLVRRWSVDMRHDIPQSDVAWGASLSEELRGPTFRLDQLFTGRLSQPIATLFVEHKDVMGLTVRLGLRNVLNGHDDLRRTYYVNRRNGPIDEVEHQVRNIHLIGVLTISGTF